MSSFKYYQHTAKDSPTSLAARIVSSKLSNSRITSDNSICNKSVLSECEVTGEVSIHDSKLTKVAVRGDVFKQSLTVISGVLSHRSLIAASSIFNSRLIGSEVRNSVVTESLIKNSSILEKSFAARGLIFDSELRENSFVAGRVVNSILYGSTVEFDAEVRGLQLPVGYYIKDGVWERLPERVVMPEDYPYDVYEGVDGLVLVGCTARPVAKWLKTSREAYIKIGISPMQYFNYKRAIEKIADLKIDNPSPTTRKGQRK